jgi:hypothetical protein
MGIKTLGKFNLGNATLRDFKFGEYNTQGNLSSGNTTLSET